MWASRPTNKRNRTNTRGGFPNPPAIFHIMDVREIKENELNELLALYIHLHETDLPEQSYTLSDTWNKIINDSNHHIIVAVENGKLVSSAVCVIIPNLTRGIRPYAFLENVVTHTHYRNRGYATACLNYARDIAISENCYKIMLLTSAKDEPTLSFYKKAGYNSDDKTAFVQWL